MGAFLLQILRNLAIGIALSYLSRMFSGQKKADPPKPQENDFAPTADEGTEIQYLFGCGAIPITVAAVFDREVEAIKR